MALASAQTTMLNPCYLQHFSTFGGDGKYVTAVKGLDLLEDTARTRLAGYALTRPHRGLDLQQLVKAAPMTNYKG